VASCHSEDTGQIFIDAGVKHVICVKKAEAVDLSTYRLFLKYFFDFLYKWNYSICYSFKEARKKIKEDSDL